MTTSFEDETHARLEAVKLTNRHTFAALLLALGEARALDVAKALTLVESFATALKQPYGVSDPVALRSMALAAEEMGALRKTVLGLVTVPAGAGRA